MRRIRAARPGPAIGCGQRGIEERAGERHLDGVLPALGGMRRNLGAVRCHALDGLPQVGSKPRRIQGEGRSVHRAADDRDGKAGAGLANTETEDRQPAGAGARSVRKAQGRDRGLEPAILARGVRGDDEVSRVTKSCENRGCSMGVLPQCL